MQTMQTSNYENEFVRVNQAKVYSVFLTCHRHVENTHTHTSSGNSSQPLSFVSLQFQAVVCTIKLQTLIVDDLTMNHLITQTSCTSGCSVCTAVNPIVLCECSETKMCTDLA